MLACDVEQTLMGAFLSKIGGLPTRQMQDKLAVFMKKQNTDESAECLRWLQNGTPKTLGELAVLSVLVNDGLIMYSEPGQEHDAEHISLEINRAIINELKADAANPRPASPLLGPLGDMSVFEAELEQLTRADSVCSVSNNTDSDTGA